MKKQLSKAFLECAEAEATMDIGIGGPGMMRKVIEILREQEAQAARAVPGNAPAIERPDEPKPKSLTA